MYNQVVARQENIDRAAFYKAMDELNYGGMSKFAESHSLRLVKHFNHNVE